MMEGYYGAVYRTTNLVNGKQYIGKVVFARKNDWERYLGSGVYLKRAINKYGRDNFRKELVFLAESEQQLRDAEVRILRETGAAESPLYYNLKDTAIGGDVFSHHPQRERIREMRRQQMSGSRNHQAGKPKTERMLNAVTEANSRPITVDGIRYASISQAAAVLALGTTTVFYRLHSTNFHNYQALGWEPTPDVKVREKCHPVEVDGVVYASMAEAARAVAVAGTTIKKRLASPNFPSYKRLSR